VSGAYRTIVADPPWATTTGPSWGLRDKSNPSSWRSHRLSYEVMTVQEIAALRPPAANDAHLYLWTINAYVDQSYDVAREWGFTPSTLLTWCKPPKGVGLGGAFALSSEFVLFARRGSLAALTRIDRNWFTWPRSTHSRKPEAFLDLVERVSPGPYLELFARRQRFGWDTWGTEALEHVALAESPDRSEQ
jgi:N6-adenosine-specific RNA methylase IME4